MSEIVRRLRLADAVEIEGHVDAVLGGKVHGWAWDRVRPEDRLPVEIWLADQRLGTGIADQDRADLSANGIGDGRHAFEITLDRPIPPGRETGLVLRAISPTTGMTATAQPRMDAAGPGANGALSQLITLAETQSAAQGEIMTALQKLSKDVRALSLTMASDADRVAAPRVEHAVIGAQIHSLEMAMMRFDGTLASLERRIERTAARAASEAQVNRLVWGTVGLAGLAVAIALASLIRLVLV